MTGPAAPGDGRGRLLRAGAVSTLSVALGGAAHWLEGHCVAVPTLTAAGVAVAAGTWVLTRREVGGTALLVWLGLTQAFLHVALSAACADPTGPTQSLSGWMLPAHAAAVCVSALALRSAEAALWARQRLLRRRRVLAALLASLASEPEPPATGAAALTAHRSRIREQLDPVVMTGGRRGPPAALFAA